MEEAKVEERGEVFEEREVEEKSEEKEVSEKKEVKEEVTKEKKEIREEEVKVVTKETKEEDKEPREVVEKRPEKKKFGLFKKRVIREEDIKDLLWDLQISLLESDVALETAEKICNDLKENLVGREIKKGEIEKVVKEEIKKSLFEILDLEPIDLIEEVGKKKPYVILFLGFNGSGKTTAIARVAYLLKQNGFTVNMAAGDTWRAAAINQLEKHGEKLKVPVIKHDYGADPAAVIFDAIEHAKARGIDVVLADTAGRTHTNVNLMKELEKIIRVNKPDLKILVIDSLTGNDAVEQARAFDEAVGVDGIILTKMDVNEKGGAALSVTHAIKKPILYIGVGQEYGDLEKFNPRKFIQNLLE
ncbi:MAG TPA: signal recognition particle-docking protein FtsY [Candidatus Aenigmarchaeota archaeon]|nr:signal recognition particle-docking protein FtsY [Candidatus Aenigmarchaeota archaeon]